MLNNPIKHGLVAAIAFANISAPALLSAESLALEEIIVTAQKRDQSLQDVPVAVSVISGEQLKEAVIKDVFDLQTNTPGLVAFQSQSSIHSSFNIRGVGTSSQNYGLESSVGLYVDGTYRSRQSTMINNMIDMEAVEVLRGPQGTLFGKNTPSGAILFKTKAPSFEPDAFISATIGNYGLLNTSAGGNVTLIEDELALRATVFRGERDGIVDAVGFGDNEVNNRDRWGARVQALWEPSDDLSVRIIGDYSKIDEICCAAQTYKSNVTASDTTNNGAPIFGSDAVLIGLGGTITQGNQLDDYSVALNTLPTATATDRGLSIDIQWQRGDYTLNSISSYRKYDAIDQIDSDFSDVDIINTTNDAQTKSFTQEFRIDYIGEDLTAVVGAYYFTQDVVLDYTLAGGTQLGDFIGIGNDLNALTAGINSISGFTGVTPAAAFPNDFDALHTSKQEQSSWALFGQFDYNITESLVLTFGARYTEESKDLSTVFTETIGGAAWVPGSEPDLTAAGTALFFAGNGDFSMIPTVDWSGFGVAGWGGFLFDGFYPRDDISAKIEDEQITGSIKLSWFVNEDVMTYASFGTGYKSGGTNTDRINKAFEPVFDAETSESFELGLKMEIPEQAMRINAALHYTSIDDFQANAFTGTGFNLQNAGSLETYGAEVEGLWQAAENTTVNLAYAYTHAIFEDFEKGNCWVAYTFHTGIADPGANGDGSCNRSGDDIPGAPEQYINIGVKQNFNISDNVEAYIYGEYNYRSDHMLDGNNDPYKREKGYGLLNLRAGVDFIDADISLTLWARNITDERFRQTTFDPPIQNGKLMSYVSEPRTFGLTFNKNF